MFWRCSAIGNLALSRLGFCTSTTGMDTGYIQIRIPDVLDMEYGLDLLAFYGLAEIERRGLKLSYRGSHHRYADH